MFGKLSASDKFSLAKCSEYERKASHDLVSNHSLKCDVVFRTFLHFHYGFKSPTPFFLEILKIKCKISFLSEILIN